VSECKNIYQVLAWDAVRLIWTVRSTHDELDDAQENAEALQRRTGMRVRVKPATRVVVTIKQEITNKTRQFREQASMEISDLADAKKYYKSPG
jgi:adenylate cyclase class IV